jgi:hypothetical protein
MLGSLSHTPHALFCWGILRGGKKNADVFVHQIDNIAGELSELLLTNGRLVVPQGCFRIGFIERLSH